MGPRRQRKRKPSRRPRWRPSLESLESRRVLSGIPLGALPDDTAEFLLGRVAVTPVFFESNGAIDSESQNWTTQEIQGVLQKIREGMDWWVDTLAALDTVHSLEFAYDETFALEPVETPYEPIDRKSDFYSRYVGDWLTDIGFGDFNSMEKAIRAFNHQQRLALETDWAFTIVVVDSSDDPDGQFASGGSFSQAFAFPGGLFMVVPSTRPASTFAHEMGHLFWARDEYTGGGSWTDQRGYYDAQNLNATDNPTPGFQHQPSIMSSGVVLTEAYANNVSPASTLAFVGWQDSNGNGIFDVLDVPLHLEGSGHYNADSGLYTFDGAAWAVALENRNSSGLQNDVTLNRISRIEYSVDGGDFVTAIAPHSQQADFSLSVSPPPSFQSIRIRAIDAQTGITSSIIEATPTRPGYADAAAAAYAFLDTNENGSREGGESVLVGVNARITSVAGRDSLPGGSVDPAEHSSDALLGSLEGVTLSVDGPAVDDRVGVAVDQEAPSQKVFAAFDQRLSRWDTGWSALNVLVADFDEATSDVRIDVIGIEANSVARMEAYDAEGNYLFRSNSRVLQEGETASLRLEDSQSRIAQVRIFGHARTEVALGRLEFGPRFDARSGKHGVIRFENLPDGIYDVFLEPELVIHQLTGEAFSEETIQITVSDGTSPELAIPVRRVHSPWTNPVLAADVDQNGAVEPLDALKIINDLNRNGTRNLRGSEFNGVFVDANNDGWVTPADALNVINALNRQMGSGEGESRTIHSTRQPSLPPPTSLASATNTTLSNGPILPMIGEGEGVSRPVDKRDRDAVERQPPSPAPSAIRAADQVFRHFAAEPPQAERPAPVNTAEGAPGDDASAARDPNHEIAPINLFFLEPFAGPGF